MSGHLTPEAASELVQSLITAVEEDDTYATEQASAALIKHLSGEYEKEAKKQLKAAQAAVVSRLEKLQAVTSAASEAAQTMLNVQSGDSEDESRPCGCNYGNPFICLNADVDEPCACGCHSNRSWAEAGPPATRSAGVRSAKQLVAQDEDADDDSTLSGDIFS